MAGRPLPGTFPASGRRLPAARAPPAAACGGRALRRRMCVHGADNLPVAIGAEAGRGTDSCGARCPRRRVARGQLVSGPSCPVAGTAFLRAGRKLRMAVLRIAVSPVARAEERQLPDTDFPSSEAFRRSCTRPSRSARSGLRSFCQSFVRHAARPPLPRSHSGHLAGCQLSRFAGSRGHAPVPLRLPWPSSAAPCCCARRRRCGTRCHMLPG